MTRFRCRECRQPYPEKPIHRCPACGGTFEIADHISFHLDLIEPNLPGIWKYRHTFGLPENSPLLTLGEGSTPLIPVRFQGQKIYLKLETTNPTGSFKDRLTATEMSWLAAHQVLSAVEDSSGNAGASFAAYAARAGIRAKVFIPANTSGPKRQQMEAYGAEVIPVEGPRSAASQAVLQAVDEGAVYASHAYLPFGLPGLATIAYEIVEQLGEVPGTVIAPVGHGSLLLGMLHGFIAMLRAGVTNRMPDLIGVQAATCAPLLQMLHRQISAWGETEEGETLAEGVRIITPVHGDSLIFLSKKYPIQFTTVAEGEILPGRDHLAHMGFYVEITSSIVWPALVNAGNPLRQPIVLVLTGSGLKS